MAENTGADVMQKRMDAVTKVLDTGMAVMRQRDSYIGMIAAASDHWDALGELYDLRQISLVTKEPRVHTCEESP